MIKSTVDNKFTEAENSNTMEKKKCRTIHRAMEADRTLGGQGLTMSLRIRVVV